MHKPQLDERSGKAWSVGTMVLLLEVVGCLFLFQIAYVGIESGFLFVELDDADAALKYFVVSGCVACFPAIGQGYVTIYVNEEIVVVIMSSKDANHILLLNKSSEEA